jgi:hypothetical protein
MKKKNEPRQMWNDREDRYLLDLLDSSPKMTWNQIAEKLHQQHPEMGKSGKRCRERYRNYLNPSIKERPWTKSEKTLFIVLHNYYKNHWGDIAKFYTGRSDISIKNLFYAYMRRVLKKVKNKSVITDIISKPKKLLKVFYILNLINEKYLPTLDKIEGEIPDIKKEKIVLGLIKAKKITKDEIVSYMDKLLDSCENIRTKEVFPIIIDINLEALKLNPLTEKTLLDILSQQQLGELSKFIKIQAISSFDKPILTNSDLPLNASSPLNFTFPLLINPNKRVRAVEKKEGAGRDAEEVYTRTFMPALAPPCGLLYFYNPFLAFQSIISRPAAYPPSPDSVSDPVLLTSTTLQRIPSATSGRGNLQIEVSKKTEEGKERSFLA